MDCCELPVTISAIACMLAKDMDDDELNLWSSIFNQLGDTLSTILAQRNCMQKSNDAGGDTLVVNITRSDKDSSE